ncbi:DUF4856 domain-containing protein [Botryobacter ruber]|uniref:DUF4856 domain-containing protein n=1 Tax=Botryobacter ruber TaxID=2171629 RepID=UPI0013E2F8CB|nr:DUF4856 domain-containing protein [Botryobacter ruber]
MFTSLKSKTFVFAALASSLIFSSCSDDKDKDPSYTVPQTYNFANVNYSGQTARINMLSELDAYIKTANNGDVLSAQKLKDMYANTNNRFSDQSLNTSGKQLKDKTILTAQSVFENYFDKVAQASQSAGLPAVEGISGGILTTADNKNYLVDANGVELAQVIQKGLMGAVFYFQAVDSYLTAEKTGEAVDNTNVTEGEGTKMEHHFDEAFGYFGAPIDFPANLNNLKFWANYSNQLDSRLNSNKTMMDAFLKGRAAISAKDKAAKDAAISTIRSEWERIVAASAIHELNAAKTNLADQAKKSHYLSEAIGFVMSLQYKTDRKLTNTQYNQVMSAIGTNLYETDAADIAAAIDVLSAAYGMDTIKAQL